MLAGVFFLQPHVSAAIAQQLWSHSKAGMSVDEVKAKFPEAAIPKKSNNLANGAIEKLQIENLVIDGNPFRVRFYFLDEKLIQVTLSFAEKKSFNLSMLRYRNISTILRSKYGHEIGKRSKRGLLNMEERQWRTTGGTNISNLMISVGNGEAVWNINQQIRMLTEAEKL